MLQLQNTLNVKARTVGLVKVSHGRNLMTLAQPSRYHHHLQNEGQATILVTIAEVLTDEVTLVVAAVSVAHNVAADLAVVVNLTARNVAMDLAVVVNLTARNVAMDLTVNSVPHNAVEDLVAALVDAMTYLMTLAVAVGITWDHWARTCIDPTTVRWLHSRKTSTKSIPMSQIVQR